MSFTHTFAIYGQLIYYFLLELKGLGHCEVVSEYTQH